MPVLDEKTPLFKSQPTPQNNIQEDIDVPFLEENSSINVKPENIDAPKRTAGLLSSIANLALACIGAGILGFPFAFKSTGLLTGIFLTSVLVILGASTLLILALASIKVDGSTYQDTVLKMLGPYWSIVSEIFLIIYHVGACTVYLTVISDTAVPFFRHQFGGVWYADRRFVVSMFAIFIVFPLICLKKVSLLSYTSGLAILSSAYTCVFIVIQGIYNIYSAGGIAPGVHVWINPSFQIIGSLPIITFAFQCHIMLIPLYAELENPTIGRMCVVIAAALGMCLIFEGTVAIFGYLTFGAATMGNILLNYPMKSIPAGVARVGMGFVAIFSYPMANFTARLTVRSLIFKRDPNFNDIKFYAVTVLWFLMTLSIALFVPNISVVFGLTGSLGCTAVMFLFPGLMLWVLANDYPTAGKVLARLYAVFLVVFGTIILIGGTFVSVMDIALGPKWADYLDWWRK